MSTSLLYHGFGIQGYEYVRTSYKGGKVIFRIQQKSEELRCPECNARNIVRRGQVERRFWALPIGRKPVQIALAIQRVWCMACNLVRQVKLGFADPRRCYTKAFERFTLELCRHMTIQDVARHLGVSWDLVKGIQKRDLQKRFSCPVLKQVRRLAIDEICIGKGHRYLTIVLDLISGAVVFVGDGKGSEALEPFWKRLRRCKAKIEAVAIDMSPAYISAVGENLPKAKIVFDHFHIIKLYNERLADLRRKLYNTAKTVEDQQVIKGTRWLLLKNPENLDSTRNEKQRLQAALEFNKPLAIAYYMKEELRQLWSQPSKEAAGAALNDWIGKATSACIPILTKVANTLAAHRSGILAFYDHQISTGPLEGTNNKIKTMKRQAYGYRDLEFFKLKIMAIHESKYALVG